MSESSEDLPRRHRTVQSKSIAGAEWIASNWKAGLAFVYSVIVLADFVVFPIYTGFHRVELLNTIQALPDLLPADRAKLLLQVMTPYVPKTLAGGGMIHLAFGALLTGATLQDKLK